MSRNRMLPVLTIALSVALALSACNKTGSADSGKSSAGAATANASTAAPQVSANERDAREAVLAEIHKQWVKTPDGWTTAKTFGVSVAPDHFLRQIRDINISHVEPAELTEADRANGFEWAGEVSFNPSPCREAGDQGILLDGMASQTITRQRGRWTQWIDFQPEPMRVQKQKGKWQVTQDTWFLRGGNLPTAADYSHAGVK
jgi:hypothetical protein